MLLRVADARDCAPCQKWAEREGFVAFSTTTTTTSHYTPIHYNYTVTTFHYTLRSTKLHCTQVHSITFNYTTLHYTTLHYNYTQLHYTTFHNNYYTTPHYTPIHYTTTTTTPSLHSTTLHSATLKMDLSAMQLKERVFWHWIALSVTARIQSPTGRAWLTVGCSLTRPKRPSTREQCAWPMPQLWLPTWRTSWCRPSERLWSTWSTCCTIKSWGQRGGCKVKTWCTSCSQRWKGGSWKWMLAKSSNTCLT